MNDKPTMLVTRDGYGSHRPVAGYIGSDPYPEVGPNETFELSGGTAVIRDKGECAR